MFIDMSIPASAGPRLLRPVGAPLGSYFRVGKAHLPLQALIAENRGAFSGLVFDGWAPETQTELRKAASGIGVETVLDTHGFELATPGGASNDRVAGLPWAGTTLPHSISTLAGDGATALVDEIADHVAGNSYTSVLAPSHLIEATDDGWLALDLELVRRLRVALDARQLRNVPIYYSLTMRTKLLNDPRFRSQAIARLAGSPIDALWLRVHPFGTTSAGPLALRRYIEASRDFHRLGIPVVAQNVGTVGLALMAFGAVGGIEGGITYGERFDASPFLKPPKDDGPRFSPAPRVYLSSVGAFVSREQARALFAHRQLKSTLACRDTGCCQRGPVDTDRDPRRHFIIQRNGEVSRLGIPPAPLRAGHYLESFVRPASDLALRAARVSPDLGSTRDRLEGWRRTLGAMQQEGPVESFAPAPEGKRAEPRLEKGA